MNAQQLEEAAVRLEEAFVPAVKRLRGRSSMEVVLDSLFEGEDDAGQFVVRFEVTVTRCARVIGGNSSCVVRRILVSSSTYMYSSTRRNVLF